jgi:hypothetical protein
VLGNMSDKIWGIDKDPIGDVEYRFTVCVAAHPKCGLVKWADRLCGFPGRTVILWSIQAEPNF